MKTLFTIILAVFFCAANYADVKSAAVLTGNKTAGKKSNCFPEDTAFINTGASFSWVKDGEYATDAETLKTGADFKVLFDGNNGQFWKSRTYSKWRGTPWATIVIDLKKKYQVSSVDVWRLHEETRDTESAEILFSSDGKEFKSQGVAKDSANVPYQAKTFFKINKEFKKPVSARYIKLRIKRRKGAKQQQIGEIVVWGVKPNNR